MNIKILPMILLFSFITISACAEMTYNGNISEKSFERSKFVIEDYANYDAFRKIIPEVFPVGTPKSEVDHVMIDSNNMNHFEDYSDISGYERIQKGEKLVRYTKMHYTSIECKFIVVSIFTKDNVLRFIKGYYGCTGP